MRLRRNKKFAAEVSTGSMNDIMFFLMLFFLIVSTLVNPNVIKLMLPNAKSNFSQPKQQITISVTKDLEYFINKKPVPFNQLESEILNETKRLNQPTVFLRFDNSLTVQDLVDILQIGDKLKIKMVLATKHSG